MANNEVSGIVMNLALARYVQEHVKHPDIPIVSYLFLRPLVRFSTLGYFEHLKAHLKAGFILSCVEDDRAFLHRIKTR